MASAYYMLMKSIIIAGETVSHINSILSQQLKSLSHWVRNNRRSEYFDKSESISIGNSR